MRAIIKSIVVITLVIIIAAPALAKEEDIGATAAGFLKIGPGARPGGMGEAFTALVYDVNSIYWNPAGLGYVQNREIMFMHNNYFQGIDYEYLAYVHSIDEKSAWGLAAAYVNEGDVQRTTVANQRGTNLDKFSNYGLSVVLSYGNQFRDNLSLGGNIKYISEKLEHRKANAFAVDVGIHYVTPVRGVTAAATLQNAGTKMKFMQKEYDLPLTVKVGLGYIYPVKYGHFNLAVDVVRHRADRVFVNTGLEFYFRDLFFARVGYTGRNDLDNGLTAGGGLMDEKWNFDYSFTPYGKMGNAHRVSINYRF